MAQATMAETRVWLILRRMLVERLGLPVREPNCLRTIVGGLPVRGEDDIVATTTLRPCNLQQPASDPSPALRRSR